MDLQPGDSGFRGCVHPEWIIPKFGKKCPLCFEVKLRTKGLPIIPSRRRGRGGRNEFSYCLTNHLVRVRLVQGSLHV
jgi:hypothetical protein